ncbi:MAG: PQQ-binding-like beta-propeller repeat protein [Planctomycetia bacterium]|nr:PQQ-binding-like beta-propeller repeat protein [Planctomycetia bacterium]
MTPSKLRWLGIVVLFLGMLSVAAHSPRAAAGDWPQWRGPDRSNVSPETGLLKEWPKDGPPLLWKASGLGESVGGIAVAGGKIYSLGYKDKEEFLVVRDVKDGKELWRAKIGPAVPEAGIMRWLSQRTPTVDGDRVYAFRAYGEVVCLETAAGKELWRKDYQKEFAGKRGNWGFCDFPMIDGDKLICTPGGDAATLVALNKKTGELIWKCPIAENRTTTNSSIVITEAGGVRQYVQQLSGGVVGVAAADGKLLWRYDKVGSSSGNVYTALVKGDLVFSMCGWGSSSALLQIVSEDQEVKIKELAALRLSLPSWIGSAVLVGDHIYVCATSGPACIELKTGKVLWDRARPGISGQLTMTYADGHMVLRAQDGKVVLAEANPQGFRVKGEFSPPRLVKEPAWTFPVIVGGRLYLRDQDELFCYDIQEKKEGRRRAPDAIFVPTPQDVVEKMLDLAKVAKDDVVYDLGCGDGRIVVTAAKKYGCKAVGVDLDPDCVQEARDNVKKAGVEALVRIEQQDIFRVDLSKADVVALYLLPALNLKLVPQLEKMKPGARIVSHAFDMKGYVPDRVIRVTSKEDELERPLFLWTTPLKKAKE